MDDFLFLRKYRSRETARPCGGSIYANQIRDAGGDAGRHSME